MSRYSGAYYPGASKKTRKAKRREAQERFERDIPNERRKKWRLAHRSSNV